MDLITKNYELKKKKKKTYGIWFTIITSKFDFWENSVAIEATLLIDNWLSSFWSCESSNTTKKIFLLKKKKEKIYQIDSIFKWNINI